MKAAPPAGRLKEPSGDRMTKTLRVATYNIRKAIGQDARRDPERILKVVADLGADVVALQEADYRFKGRQAIFDPDAIRVATGLAVVPMTHGHSGIGWHGNFLLAAPRLLVADAGPIHLPGLEPRGAVRADFVVDGRPLRLVAAHLGLIGIHRRRQADALVAAAEPENGHATIVMGDFNGWGRARYSLEPLERTMQEAPCGRSFPSNRPLARLDRIYFGGPLALVDCGVVRSPETRVASDHLPAVAEFVMAAPDEPPVRAPPAAAIPRPRRLGELAKALKRRVRPPRP
jgi:endonuclease/exonuclease/phosphatase family metal-dependent hydrolase